MKRNLMAKRFAAIALALVLILAGVVIVHAQNKDPSDTLKGIDEALIATDSDSSQNKATNPEQEYSEEEYVVYVPDADAFGDFYFRVVAGIPRGTAGASLSAAQAACNVLGFAADNELWLADEDTLRANMLEAWEGLTDDERTNFDANFEGLNGLVNSCFEDWDANLGRFDDAGVSEKMEKLLEDGTSQRSWDTLSAHTRTLGSGE